MMSAATMRFIMVAIIATLVGSILSILVIKPFSHGGNEKNAETPATIQQPDPQKQQSGSIMNVPASSDQRDPVLPAGSVSAPTSRS